MKLQSFLEDNSGGFSSTRLAFLLWAVGALVAWLVVSIRAESLQSLDNSVIAIIGILMTGKVAQRFGEKAETESAGAGAGG
jgi:hypothetical protein